MATRRYKINPAEFNVNGNQIVEEVGAATNSKGIELTIDLSTAYKKNGLGVAVALSKEDILIALEELEQYIINRQWPPA